VQALDVAWILVSAALVMFMQAGFSSLETGLVRTKNSINVAAEIDVKGVGPMVT
jgi:Amt family ammonium transporter